MKAFLTEYLRYNVWANDQFIMWLSKLPEEALNEKVPSSFPSISETMLHIWDAQFIWLNRLQGQSPDVFPSKEFEGDWEEICNNVHNSSNALLTLARAKEAKWFQVPSPYKLMNGDEMRTIPSEMILHCTQHSTFHRGQIVTIAHVLHMTEPIPQTDYIFFARQRDKANL
jgi:uncharacterized damage-inducible protein DinB